MKPPVKESPAFEPGQQVRIVNGPFRDFLGRVYDVDMDRKTLRVLISFLGRETPVEVDFLYVENM